jgi:neutral amino acid transport system substrate-binding protein
MNIKKKQSVKPKFLIVLLLMTLTGFLTSCNDSKVNPKANGLKIGSLLSKTGELASIGSSLPISVKMAVDTVNACGGVNGSPITLISEDDQSDPAAGAAAMTKLSAVDKVAGVVGAFGSSVSTAAADIAAKNKVMIVSPASTSPVFTDRAKQGAYQGYWARTAPSDMGQSNALAQLAIKKGFKKVATIVVNNDYGIGLEKEFVATFKKLGGTVINEARPTRYDAKGASFNSEVKEALKDKPQALVAIIHPESGAILLKDAYELGCNNYVARCRLFAQIPTTSRQICQWKVHS